MKDFPHINAKLFDALSRVTIINFRWSSSRFFLYLSHSVCLGLIFCLSYVIFSFTLANTVSFHGLKFEVTYLVLRVIDSIHVSRAVAISVHALEQFGVFYSLGPVLEVF